MWFSHVWEVTGVNAYQKRVYDYLSGQWYNKNTYTEVLKVCSHCGKTKVEEIEGYWTLDQIRGRK